MSGTINDVTTVLNPGVGGDNMDESSVTQSDGVTVAKRPRVVPATDDGYVQTFAVEGSGSVKAEVSDSGVEDTLRDINTTLCKVSGLLVLIAEQLGCNVPDDGEVSELGKVD